VCNSVRASCDGKYWEITTSDLACPNCDGYYYDDGYYSDSAPNAPENIAASKLTATSVTITWSAPTSNFMAGTDGYSLAYAATNDDDDLSILNVTTMLSVDLKDLRPGTEYKVSILPVIAATEDVGEPGHFDFKTLPAAGKGKKAKGPKGAKAKAAPVAKGKANP
jgi:hypothetical protein